MSNQLGWGTVLVTADGSGTVPDAPLSLLADACDSPPTLVNGVWVGTWGLGGRVPTATAPILLTSTNQSEHGTVAPSEIARWLADGDLRRLGRMLPPFGAVGLTNDGLRVTTDQFAFRNVFRCHGDGWSAISTSALVLARFLGRGLDPLGLRLQSQLGYQLGELTLFEGVSAIAARESLLVTGSGIHSEWIQGSSETGVLPLDAGVEQVAQGLRNMVTTYLDEGHDPSLQLTGGQDSRIVLSCVPKSRRRGLKVMTLQVPGSPDAAIAHELAGRYGMDHTVRTITAVDSLPPGEWFHRVVETARANECMADPIARAVTGWAEESFEQGHRLSGLGGELARGFFYLGAVRPVAVTRRRSEQLAKWRMLANEAVAADVLALPYRDAYEVSVDIIHGALSDAGTEWYTATDELYLHRMRRWAGLGEGAVSSRRTLVNPMLDHRFTEAVARISPAGKKGSRFLGLLQVALDEELASFPLDGRPAPRAYATPTSFNTLRVQTARLRKLATKASQRLLGKRRPPAGGSVVANKLSTHLRENPSVLEPARESGVFDPEWLHAVSRGERMPAASDLALLMNVISAGREGAL